MSHLMNEPSHDGDLAGQVLQGVNELLLVHIVFVVFKCTLGLQCLESVIVMDKLSI